MINLPTSPHFDRLSVYLAPYIPQKKLNNAIDTCAPFTRLEDVLLLVDNTVFGSAKDCLFLTETQLYYKEPFEDAVGISLNNIAGFSAFRHTLHITFKGETAARTVSLSTGSKNDILALSQYLSQLLAEINRESEKLQELEKEKVKAEEQAKLEEQFRLEARKQLILEEERRKFEIEQQEREKARQNISLQSQSAGQPLEIRQVIQSVPQKIIHPEIEESRYFGTRIDDNDEPEPPYFGEEYYEECDDSDQSTLSENDSIVGKFLQNNSDGIMAKLKTSGLTLTSTALQNDDYIIRIAGVIYNLLPGPVRFVVSVSMIENFLLNNRGWLIQKLK